MKICKICGEEINLQVFGLDEDLCWGCANKQQKSETLDKNMKLKEVSKE